MTERLFVRLDEDPLRGPEASVPPETLRTLPVSAALRGHVAHVLAYRETFDAGTEVLERVLPDGALRIVFHLADTPVLRDGSGIRAAVVGASASPALVRLGGSMDGVSITLRPGAAAALLGVPAGAITDTALPLEELWRSDGREAIERLGAQRDDRGRAAVLQAILERRLRTANTAIPPAASRAAGLIVSTGGQQPLRVIAATVGVGERRLQQLFHAHVGLSPRVWSRLARLHTCLRALRSPNAPRWAELAATSGFYDQSHLVNEFRAFCGLTPSEFQRRTSSGSSKTAR